MDERAPSRKPRRAASGGEAQPAPMRAFSRSLPMALLRARESVMNRFRPNLRAHDLTDQQWRVIRALVDHGELQITELAEECCLLMPSLSRILQNLEERGLVRRRTSSGDQRRFVISVTEDGLALFRSVAPISEARYAEIAARIGPERLEQLYALLEETIETLDEAEENAGQKT